MLKLTPHKKHLSHHKIKPVGFVVITTSNTRTLKTDQTGQLIIQLLSRAGHKLQKYLILKNNPNQIRREVRKLLRNQRIQLIITSGGTGCGRKDLTVEAISPLLAKRLDGFGELFRLLSYREIGSAALMSRALLGLTATGKIICSLPGSTNAARLALKQLLLPELNHLIWEAHR